VPIAIDLVSLLAAFVAFLVCYALLVAYKSTLGAVLQTLANALHGVSILGTHPLDFLADGLTALDSDINAALSDAVLATEHAWQRVLTYTGTLIHEALHGIDELAGTVERAFSHTTTILIPSKIAEKTLPLWRNLASLRKEVESLIAKGLHASNTITHVITHDVPLVTTKVIRLTKVETVKVVRVIEHGISIPLPRVGALERDVTGLEKWVRAHTKDLTIGGIASLLIGGVLAKMGMTWLRCSNVNRAGKALCGMNANVLEALLAGLVSIFGTIGIITFAKDVQDVTADFGNEVAHFWRADVPGPGGDRALGSATLN
jgi:hypothetical protein